MSKRVSSAVLLTTAALAGGFFAGGEVEQRRMGDMTVKEVVVDLGGRTAAEECGKLALAAARDQFAAVKNNPATEVDEAYNARKRMDAEAQTVVNEAFNGCMQSQYIEPAIEYVEQAKPPVFTVEG